MLKNLREGEDRFYLWLSIALSLLTLTCLTYIHWKRIKWGNVPDYIPLLAVVLAFLGLSTWRRQLRGTHDFELARRTLSNLYVLRDAIINVRNPWMEASEAGNTDDAPDIPWQSAAYQKRWDRVTATKRKLDVSLLEVEAVWGDLLKADYRNLASHISRLFIATRRYTTSLRPGEEDVFTLEERNILYSVNEEDDYSQTLSTYVGALENKLRDKLRA